METPIDLILELIMNFMGCESGAGTAGSCQEAGDPADAARPNEGRSHGQNEELFLIIGIPLCKYVYIHLHMCIPAYIYIGTFYL